VTAEAVAEFLTPAEAGRILNLTPDGVRLAADTGRLRVAATTQSGRRLFLRDDVERFRRDRAKAKR
jgi:DNA-binding transcriptional MerR regulator